MYEYEQLLWNINKNDLLTITVKTYTRLALFSSSEKYYHAPQNNKITALQVICSSRPLIIFSTAAVGCWADKSAREKKNPPKNPPKKRYLGE